MRLPLSTKQSLQLYNIRSDYQENIFFFQKPKNLTARSVTQLESGGGKPVSEAATINFPTSGSCTNLQQDLGGVAYTNMAASNTAR